MPSAHPFLVLYAALSISLQTFKSGQRIPNIPTAALIFFSSSSKAKLRPGTRRNHERELEARLYGHGYEGKDIWLWYEVLPGEPIAGDNSNSSKDNE